MTIPVMQFPQVQVPNETNSLLTGLTTGLQIYSQLMNAMAAPGQAKQAQSESQAKLGLTQAQTDLTKAQTQKLLSPEQPEMKSTIGNTVQDYHNIVNQYGINSPETKQASDMIKSDSDYKNAMASSRQAYASGFGEMMAPKTVRDQRILSYMNQGYSLDQSVQLAADQSKTNQISPSGMTQESQQQASQLGSEITKTTTPVDVQKRQYAGARAEMTLKNLNQFVDQGALNYSGLSGKGKLAKDETTSALTGNVPPQLSAYRNFQGQLNVLKDEYATTLGVPADQISRGELGSLFDVSQYSTNPQAAKQQLKNVSDLLSKTEDINFTNLHDLAAKNRDIAGQYEKKDSLTVKPQSLSQATPDQAKKLGMEKVQIPQFNSKSEFQSWYNQQSPAVQSLIKRQLGGQ